MSNKIIDPVRALDYLEIILGKDWLEENLKVMKDSQYGKGGFGRSIDYNELGIAHVAEIWYKAREEIIDMEIVGGGSPGPYLLSASAVANDIDLLKGSTGLEEKMDKLRDARLSLVTMHELGIASGYAQKGFHIDFINQKAADLPSTGGLPVPLCIGSFTAYDEVNKIVVVCADVDRQGVYGEILARILRLQADRLDQFAPKSGKVMQTVNGGEAPYLPVLYLYVGDAPADAASFLDEWINRPDVVRLAHDFNMPVLVCADGVKNTHNRSTYVRLGRLAQNSNVVGGASLVNDIYVPDEQITAV